MKLPKLWPVLLVFCAVLALPSSASAWWWNSGYTKTEHPIVLAHGLFGFDALFGAYDYFYGIADALRSDGATVYVTQVTAAQSSVARGEELLSQVEYIAALHSGKVNLIGHSQGGLDARYVAAVRPDLVASVTTVASPHQGAAFAQYLNDNLSPGGFSRDATAFFADSLAAIVSLISGTSRPQDSEAALEALSFDGAAQFNALFPQGLPTTPCGQGPASVGGVRYYSWSGASVLTNALDLSDPLLLLTSFFDASDNDGLVSRCSSRLGVVLRDNYNQNHLDEVNQVLGLRSLLTSSPKSIFRAHANRLKNQGL